MMNKNKVFEYSVK